MLLDETSQSEVQGIFKLDETSQSVDPHSKVNNGATGSGAATAAAGGAAAGAAAAAAGGATFKRQ